MNTIQFLVCLTLVLCLGCYEASPGGTAGTAVPADHGDSKTLQPTEALKIVGLRMNAYNDHDINRFMNLYADDIEIFTYPNKSLGKGKEHLRGLFKPMFEEGLVNVQVHGQFAQDSYVVNHETVNYGDDWHTIVG